MAATMAATTLSVPPFAARTSHPFAAEPVLAHGRPKRLPAAAPFSSSSSSSFGALHPARPSRRLSAGDSLASSAMPRPLSSPHTPLAPQRSYSLQPRAFVEETSGGYRFSRNQRQSKAVGGEPPLRDERAGAAAYSDGAPSPPAAAGRGGPPAKLDIRDLKASQIKKVLDLGGVDYRDCLEKQELVERLQQSRSFVPPAAQRLLDRYLEGRLDDPLEVGGAAYADAAVPAGSPEEGWWLEAERNAIRRFQEASPAVVHIDAIRVGQMGIFMNPVEIPRGTGSGLIWDKEGHVVTNYHVVMNGEKAKVTLSDASTWDAELVGANPNTDLAVLKIKAPSSKLTPVSVGSSQALQVGQHVMAIGNPFGLDRTLTAGIISGVGRDIRGVAGRTIRGTIQTDASINPGNSGGPLLDSQGRLIGVNTAIYSPSGASAGVGFAIPVDTVRRVVNALVRGAGSPVPRPGLGIVCASDSQARQLGVSGVLVMGLTGGGPAATGGLKATKRDEVGRIVLGDVIVAVNGQTVSTVEDLLTAVEERQVGDKVRVTVKRGGQNKDFYITLAQLSD